VCFWGWLFLAFFGLPVYGVYSVFRGGGNMRNGIWKMDGDFVAIFVDEVFRQTVDVLAVKLLVLVAELCRALDNEREDNLFRVECLEDCGEHQRLPAPVFSPQLRQYGK
jgi:hypothetical protein